LKFFVQDEVDGVKVFKPTKSDKRLPKFSLKDKSVKTHLVQTRLNFGPKKEDASCSSKKPNSSSDSENSAPKPVSRDSVGPVKKDLARKPVTPEIFGPALFSTPDIIRKIGSDDTSKGSYNAPSSE